MNPETNKFEPLMEIAGEEMAKERLEAMEEFVSKMKCGTTEELSPKLYRPDGTPVPDHWSTFHVGEEVVIKNYRFEVAYIGEKTLLFEPVGPIILGEGEK